MLCSPIAPLPPNNTQVQPPTIVYKFSFKAPQRPPIRRHAAGTMRTDPPPGAPGGQCSHDLHAQPSCRLRRLSRNPHCNVDGRIGRRLHPRLRLDWKNQHESTPRPFAPSQPWNVPHGHVHHCGMRRRLRHRRSASGSRCARGVVQWANRHRILARLLRLFRRRGGAVVRAGPGHGIGGRKRQPGNGVWRDERIKPGANFQRPFSTGHHIDRPAEHDFSSGRAWRGDRDVPRGCTRPRSDG